MSISLIYLCRGKDGGLSAADRFIDNYSKYDPGCKHNLVIVFKGWDEALDKDKQKLKIRFQALKSEIVELDDDGYDWGAYMRVSHLIQTDFICFLNSFSRPLSTLWLENIYQCIKIKDVGMCGASGAYKAWRFSLPFFEFRFMTLIMYPLRIIRRLINHLLLFGYYPSKYCPHLRSNGFAVERKTFLDFINSTDIPVSKRDCYKLESGLTSYSNYIIQQNKRLVLVDRSGNYYDIKDWINSKTYCCPGQPELCIADNNTDSYNKQNIANKRQTEFDVWDSVLHD